MVVRFGAMPASKTVLQYLQRYPACRQIVVDDEGWNDPSGLASDLLRADAGLLCQDLRRALPAELGCQPDRQAWLRAGSTPTA